MESTFALSKFLSTSLDDMLQENDGSTSPIVLRKRLKQLFSSVMLNIPAYKQLQLDINKFSDNDIDAWFSQYESDFPFLNKTKFINPNPLSLRSNSNLYSNALIFHSSSGSSGVPTFWTRSIVDELSVSSRFEQMFRDNFQSHIKSTLCIIAFPLGTWVGGIFTTFVVRFLAQKGYKLGIATPGNSVDEILKVVGNIGGMFEQVAILGYPPFVKGVVDKGLATGVKWSSMSMKFIFAGEVFTEEWRSLLASRCGITDEFNSILSMYGTADAGVLACESNLSIAIRKYLSKNAALAKKLFNGKDRIPSLMQYDPLSRYLEMSDENTISLTTMPPTFIPSLEDSVNSIQLPLLRYNIGDEGGMFDFDKLVSKLKQNGYDPLSECNSGVIRKLPFVFVFGRSFWTVSLYGSNVYVENIMAGLEQNSVCDWVTGKFVVSVVEDDSSDARLQVRVELAIGVQPDQEKIQLLTSVVEEHILRLNSEYANYVPKEKQSPIILLHLFGDPQYFPIGIKHKYT
ncbi:hypothetical protein HK098_004192 [Nowakowskiella sp. JEL0407]|nr:hypothetical protein HK098_004192 [Nowakowskiella sp. JEL0407]